MPEGWQVAECWLMTCISNTAAGRSAGGPSDGAAAGGSCSAADAAGHTAAGGADLTLRFGKVGAVQCRGFHEQVTAWGDYAGGKQGKPSARTCMPCPHQCMPDYAHGAGARLGTALHCCT